MLYEFFFVANNSTELQLVVRYFNLKGTDSGCLHLLYVKKFAKHYLALYHEAKNIWSRMEKMKAEEKNKINMSIITQAPTPSAELHSNPPQIIDNGHNTCEERSSELDEAMQMEPIVEIPTSPYPSTNNPKSSINEFSMNYDKNLSRLIIITFFNSLTIGVHIGNVSLQLVDNKWKAHAAVLQSKETQR